MSQNNRQNYRMKKKSILIYETEITLMFDNKTVLCQRACTQGIVIFAEPATKSLSSFDDSGCCCRRKLCISSTVKELQSNAAWNATKTNRNLTCLVRKLTR